ncbi:MAG: hypothetical protein WAK01_12750 [Methylocystis sp.]
MALDKTKFSKKETNSRDAADIIDFLESSEERAMRGRAPAQSASTGSVWAWTG